MDGCGSVGIDIFPIKKNILNFFCYIRTISYLCEKYNKMALDKVTLTYNCFGKTIEVSNKTETLDANALFDMLKVVYVAEFGEESWEAMLCQHTFNS